MIIDTDTICFGKSKWMKKRGIRAVGRYYSQVNTYKNIDKAEALELSSNGIGIFVVYEDHGKKADLTLTKEVGADHGGSAGDQAEKIGQPKGGVIYFAVEGLPNGYKSEDLPALRDYFSGVKQGLNGRYTAGVYGDGIVCQTLRDESFCTHAWLAQASYSFEGSVDYYASEDWNLAQIILDLPKDDWDQLSVDINESKGDFGAFSVPVDVAGG